MVGMTFMLYLARRWGHAESPDGPDGDDTFLLVRATGVAEAAQIAEEALANLPTTSPKSNRPVEPCCHRITELGTDAASDGNACVVILPFVAPVGALNSASYRTWMREKSWCDDWRDEREAFAE